MRILYRIDADGNGQIQNDEHNTGAIIKHASKRLGYVVTEFQMEIMGDFVEVMALTPDTMIAVQRLEIERLIRKKYPTLKQIKRIKL